jgi:hypothetical protein
VAFDRIGCQRKRLTVSTILGKTQLVVMAAIAAVVYRVLGLKILHQGWINFDLIWAVALLVVGATALYFASSS